MPLLAERLRLESDDAQVAPRGRPRGRRVRSALSSSSRMKKRVLARPLAASARTRSSGSRLPERLPRERRALRLVSFEAGQLCEAHERRGARVYPCALPPAPARAARGLSSCRPRRSGSEPPPPSGGERRPARRAASAGGHARTARRPSRSRPDAGVLRRLLERIGDRRRRACPSRARGGGRARPRPGRASARRRWSSRRPIASRLWYAAEASSGCVKRTRSPSSSMTCASSAGRRASSPPATAAARSPSVG